MLAAFDKLLAPLTWLAAAFTIVVLAVGPELIGAKAEAPATDPGEQVFADNCATCHTLQAAGAAGVGGPDLDQLQPDQATVAAAVANGPGGMPAFAGSLSAEEVDAVARYVAAAAGG